MNSARLAHAVAASILRELAVRAVSVLRFDSAASSIPEKIVFSHVSRLSQPTNPHWYRLSTESYCSYAVWGLTGTVFLTNKVIHIPYYVSQKQIEPQHPRAHSGHAFYVKIFEDWFGEPLRHMLLLPIPSPSHVMGAIKVMNRLDTSLGLIDGEAPFDNLDQAFCESMAHLLGEHWSRTLRIGQRAERRVMLCYPSHDIALCDVVAKYLSEAFPSVIIIRDTTIPVGVDLREEIKNLIASCDVTMFLLTHSSLESDWLQEEWLYANSSNRRVLPVVESSIQAQLEKRFAGLRHKTFLPYLTRDYRSMLPHLRTGLARLLN